MKAIITTMSETRHEQMLVEVEKVHKTTIRTSDGSRFSVKTRRALGGLPHAGEFTARRTLTVEGTREYRDRMDRHVGTQPGDYWNIVGA